LENIIAYFRKNKNKFIYRFDYDGKRLDVLATIEALYNCINNDYDSNKIKQLLNGVQFFLEKYPERTEPHKKLLDFSSLCTEVIKDKDNFETFQKEYCNKCRHKFKPDRTDEINKLEKELLSAKSEIDKAKKEKAKTEEEIYKTEQKKIKSEKDRDDFKAKSKINKAWKTFFGLLAILFFFALCFTIYKISEQNEEIANKSSEIVALTSKHNVEITNKTKEIADLKIELPQKYKITVHESYCYYRQGSNFVKSTWRYNRGQTLNVYTIHNGYGLTFGGWLKMSDLEKENKTPENVKPSTSTQYTARPTPPPARTTSTSTPTSLPTQVTPPTPTPLPIRVTPSTQKPVKPKEDYTAQIRTAQNKADNAFNNGDHEIAYNAYIEAANYATKAGNTQQHNKIKQDAAEKFKIKAKNLISKQGCSAIPKDLLQKANKLHPSSREIQNLLDNCK